MDTRLASQQRCLERISANWLGFGERRRERLREQERHGIAAEKVAENIIEDLLTTVLDWSVGDVNHQVGHADLLLTRLGIKYFLIEAKRPGALAWNRHAVERALDQAHRYADEQKVHSIGVSDGVMLYAADIVSGGLRDRLFASLESSEPPESLWWVSVHGIYRPRDEITGASLRLLPEPPEDVPAAVGDAVEETVHPKYLLPCRCFAFVGSAAETSSWKLPYLLSDGSVDAKRLPKAIQAILTNHRGAIVSHIPEHAIPDLLVRLARAAGRLGRLPGQAGEPAPVYRQLTEALEQVGRLEEVLAELSSGTDLSPRLSDPGR
jgi:hypothetical protein